MLSDFFDNVIGVISPKWQAQRLYFRRCSTKIRAHTGVHESMQKMLSRNRGGYEAGKLDRLKGRNVGSPHENDIPREQIAALRYRAWQLHRNCPQARKICRSLNAKVVGRGLSPQPQATTTDGDPFVEFRKRARQVWEEFGKECDYRGKPGSGGQNFVSMSKTGLRNVVLSGGLLYRFHRLSPSEQSEKNLFLPLQLQLVHIERLDENKHGGNDFYGIRLDNEGRVAGYHVLKGGVQNESLKASSKSKLIPASEMRHLFSEEDIDQFIGSPWVGAALLTMDDRRNYEYSELTAAEMASCFVAGYRRSSGHQGGVGLQQDGDRDLTDADGNPIDRLQPGMLLDLGVSGELDTFNPSRPNSSAEPFLYYLLRSEAVSMPGVKSSTLTGDYRNSSFSSERSADNDVWPEIEELQDWFAMGFCQPVYEEVIDTAVVAGKFSDVPGFSLRDYQQRKREYLKTNWQGPVARSINPKDDADAARIRVQNGTSSPQREAAQIGRDWREILQECAEFIDYAEELGVPEDIWQQALGIAQSDSSAPPEPPRPTEQEQDEAAVAVRLRNSGFISMNQG